MHSLVKQRVSGLTLSTKASSSTSSSRAGLFSSALLPVAGLFCGSLACDLTHRREENSLLLWPRLCWHTTGTTAHKPVSATRRVQREHATYRLLLDHYSTPITSPEDDFLSCITNAQDLEVLGESAQFLMSAEETLVALHVITKRPALPWSATRMVCSRGAGGCLVCWWEGCQDAIRAGGNLRRHNTSSLTPSCSRIAGRICIVRVAAGLRRIPWGLVVCVSAVVDDVGCNGVGAGGLRSERTSPSIRRQLLPRHVVPIGDFSVIG